MAEYDHAADHAAIARDIESSSPALPPACPWLVYRAGVCVAACDSFESAVRAAEEKGILGRCTIRNPYDPPPSFPSFFGLVARPAPPQAITPARLAYWKEEIALKRSMKRVGDPITLRDDELDELIAAFEHAHAGAFALDDDAGG